MNITLSHDADKLICTVYKEYLSKRKHKVSKSNAKLFSLEDFCNSNPDFNYDDAYDTLSELKSNGLVKKFITANFELTDTGIVYMESRFLNNIDKVIEYLKIFMP